MFEHEHFRLLSSLAATGQLTSNEISELNEHLKECMECLEIYEEHSHLAQRRLPQVHAARYSNRPLPLELPPSAEIRDKFLGRLRAEGACFTPNAERPTQSPRPNTSTRWQMRQWPTAVASVGLAAVLIFGIWFSGKHELSAGSAASLIASIGQPDENRRLMNELESLRRENGLSAKELDRLRTEKEASGELLRESQLDLRESQALADRLLAENQAEKTENVSLSESGQQKDAVIADLDAQGEVANRKQADFVADFVLENQRNRKLTESLDLQASNLDRERQLQSVINDVRRLMGARNLQVVDVRDIDLNQPSEKAFGRVFYAEKQSLIFYAFDLPNGITPAKYTFQAWGGQNSKSKSPKSLGTFKVDDNEQHRWILKVNDPNLLARIDNVFVTAESIRDRAEPRGKKLLYAYIGGRPNHP